MDHVVSYGIQSLSCAKAYQAGPGTTMWIGEKHLFPVRRPVAPDPASNL
jgi:hypothetical protein